MALRSSCCVPDHIPVYWFDVANNGIQVSLLDQNSVSLLQVMPTASLSQVLTYIFYVQAQPQDYRYYDRPKESRRRALHRGGAIRKSLTDVYSV